LKLPGSCPIPIELCKSLLRMNVFSLVRRRIWDFVEKLFPFLLASTKAEVLKHTVISMTCLHNRFAGTAIALMSSKKGRGNGDNSRDHSSHEPPETGCTARNLYLRHTHLPDSLSGYRKRLAKKEIRTPPSRIYQKHPSFHPFDRANLHLSRWGREARLRVNLEQATALRPGSREVHGQVKLNALKGEASRKGINHIYCAP
jgi:hypothetical protein